MVLPCFRIAVRATFATNFAKATLVNEGFGG
jgi:hypothetical protein